jgi:hypothetical protein
LALPASQGSVAVSAQAAVATRAGAGAAARTGGPSPAAQALAPGKPSLFLQLFRKITGGSKPPAGAAPTGRETSAGHAAHGADTRTPQAGEASRKRSRGAQAAELGDEAEPALRTGGGRRSRRGKVLAGAEEGRPAEAPAGAPAPARRPSGAARPDGLSRPDGVSPADSAPAAVEARKDARPAQARVVVVDLRARPAETEQQAENRKLENAPRSFERTLLEAADAGPREARPGAAAGLTRSPASLPGSVFQERLLPEIVQHAGIVLRDGGEGEIRLVLKPEHLGSVRIRLHLGESSLEGRIVVDNSNVKELLEANLEQLKSALRQEGYASANIDVTVSGDGDRRREVDPGRALPALAARPAEEFERATPVMLDLGFTAVNLFV